MQPTTSQFTRIVQRCLHPRPSRFHNRGICTFPRLPRTTSIHVHHHRKITSPLPRKTLVSPAIKPLAQWDKWDFAFTSASILQFVAFASTDIISLRVLSAGSAALFMVAHNGRQFFVGYFWCFCYLFLNMVAIAGLLLPQMTVEFTNEELDIFENLFLKYGVTPREFKTLIAFGKRVIYPRGSFLTMEGEPVNKLILITKGDAIVFRDTGMEEQHALTEIHVGIEDGSSEFVGEISFVEKGTIESEHEAAGTQLASASVQAESEIHCIEWDADQLHTMLDQNRISLHKFHAVLTKSVREKIVSLGREKTDLELDALECMLALVRATGRRRMNEDQAGIIQDYCDKQGIPTQAVEQSLAKFGMKSAEQL